MSTTVGRVRRTALTLFICFGLALLLAPATEAQWLAWQDETATRVVADPSLSTSDNQEKDYAWGDLDQDGDIDLVVVRKQPFTSPGKRANVLLMNEGGVLVDRTADFASSSTVVGDQGFLTPTNDRDVVVADINGDTWLDVVTAVTISDGDPKHIGHPRIYVNQQEDGGGNWLGLVHEDGRIPTMQSYSGQSGFNPRFCSVAAGDVNGDGNPDLWFGDYDSSGAGGFGQPSGADYNDRLLINQGAGFFTDQTSSRFSGLVSVPGSQNAPFEVSAFGAAANIADINGDSINDIIKQTSLNDPLYVGVAYNNPTDEGFFDSYDVVNDAAPYFVSIGDLNNDGRLDMVITDDGADRYLLNQGNGGSTQAGFLDFFFSFDGASDDGFGSNNLIADLNNDGWNDVLIADVDVDISGCSRRMHIYRNLGGAVGGNVTLQEQTTGTGCATNQGNPSSCVVAGIPSNKLEGVHDVAVFDLNGDGWDDMVLGRCSGMEVYMNQPPTGLNFIYPEGLPFFIDPTTPQPFTVDIGDLGAAIPAPGSGRMFADIGGTGFQEVFMNEISTNVYEATMPASSCGARIEYYFLAKTVSNDLFFDPPSAPAELYSAISATGTIIGFQDLFEGDTSAWTVVNDPSLVSGGWEAAIPVGTITGGGQQAAPDDDGGPQSDVKAFVTQNGQPGGFVGDDDVDGGPTDLISPSIDLAGTDATITYTRWFFSDGDDEMTVSVTSDGTNWTDVETVIGAANSWQVASFKVGDFVTPSATVQVRFRVSDSPNDSITEAGVDGFRVERLLCGQCSVPSECSDGIFCNGVEDCVGGTCVLGSAPCPGQECDEALDTCVECTVDLHCDDGDFCNGTETCVGNTCQAGTDPCPGQLCDDVADACVACLDDVDCDDGLFCNGDEACAGGLCLSLGDPCGGRSCDDGSDACTGPVVLQPELGDPLNDLTVDELARFAAGRVEFDRVISEPEGLGPTFNQDSCSSCHSRAVGGAGSITVTRFGFSDDKAGGFDPLDDLGGSLRQSQALSATCEEVVPPEANVTAERVTPSILGAGLVEAIADADIEAQALIPPAGVSGKVHMVQPLEDPTGPQRVGRFGWKAQVATVLTFSGDASLNEMGLTNRLVPQENAPNGDDALLAICDTVADPEDGPDGQGMHFIDRVTDFQRFTAPPPQTPRFGMTGEALFIDSGCANCHTPAFRTRDDGSLEAAIRDKTVKPYGNWLVHDMGEHADFIEQGTVTNRELRTAPLWGLRVRDPMWHDGRVGGGTFEDRIRAAILLHDGLGSEGRSSARAFNSMVPADQDDVFAFLDSLGKPEFDLDGDNDVDNDDYNQLAGCVTGPGSFYTADDACAVADVDADGDVDDIDTGLFLPDGDGDGDGVLNGADCDIFDSNTWAKPSPAENLFVIAPGGSNNISWQPPGAPGGVTVLFDVLRSGSPADFSAATCVDFGELNTVATDGAVPAAGSGFYYLVRSSNACGGNLGTDSSGVGRSGSSCP